MSLQVFTPRAFDSKQKAKERSINRSSGILRRHPELLQGVKDVFSGLYFFRFLFRQRLLQIKIFRKS